MDFLPGDYLTWADWGFLQSWHLCKGCRERNRALQKGVAASPNVSCPHTNPEIDAQRRKGFNAFVLALSDQQLVTGPAMIIAALAQRCQISCYEFTIVNSLAFLASTTHLASLLVLREYFQLHKEVRNIRVVGMLVNLVLLMYTTVVAAAAGAVDNSARIQCVMDSFPPGMDYLNITVTILFLLIAYTESISQLYIDPTSLDAWLQHILKVYCCRGERGPIMDEMFEQWYEGEVNQSKYRPGGNARRELFWKSATPLRKGDKMNLRHQLFLYLAVLFDFQEAFLSEIPTLLFSASYGVTQVIISRINKPDAEGSENTVDFGQIVPLFLLSLPVMAAVEVYYESHSGELFSCLYG